MPNPIKYSTGSESRALKKGNFFIGTNDIEKGPTLTTGYWSGITPPSGGYTVYAQKASNGPSIVCPANDTQLINLATKISGVNFSGSIESALDWFRSQSDYLCLSSDIPNIVTDNLSLYLDVNCVASYPRTGGKWFDLSNNNLTFDYQSSFPYLQTISGAKCFKFDNTWGGGNSYWQCTSGSNLVDMGGDCTLLMWVYSENFAVRRTIFEKQGTLYASYQQEIAVTWEGFDAMSWYSRQSPDYDYGSLSGINLNSWNLVGIKMSTGKTTAARDGYFSVNGNAWNQNYISRSNVAIVEAGDIVIGSGYAGQMEACAIGSVMCYSKMLSDDEISQIWNATKSTYGL